MNIKPLELAILEAYRKYGQKFYLVLSTALKIAKVNRLKNIKMPGDFEYREVVEELEKQGFKYNPSMLLRILEREYGLIETSYRTGNNHWYKFKDLEGIERALNAVLGLASDIEEPNIAMIKIQVKSLQISYWLKKLKQMSIKSKLSSVDIKVLQRFAFDVLPKIVKILKKAEEYEDQLYAEINLLKELISLASVVADRIDIEINMNDTDMNEMLTRFNVIESIND